MSYRGISVMSVVGKLHGKGDIERVRGKTKNLIVEKQGFFRKGRGCVDQVFTVKCLSENFREKRWELYFGFIFWKKLKIRMIGWCCGRL